MIAVPGAGFPKRFFFSQRVDHQIPIGIRALWQIFTHRRQPGLMIQQHFDRDVFFAGLGKLGPVGGDRRVEVELAARRQDVSANGRRAFC